MAYNVSQLDAYLVLYFVLGFFALLALASRGWFNEFLPQTVTRFWTLNHPARQQDASGNVADDEDDAVDYFLSARNSAGPWAIALSFFASGMGAWVLYGTTEMGATPALSWLGVLGYSGASAFPAMVICFLGPMVRDMSSNRAFSTSDFGRERYGRVMQVAISAVSFFYMFIYIVAELTSISNIFGVLAPECGDFCQVTITVSIGIVTILYTTVAGLPASIVTDKFQGIIMGTLVILLTFALTTESENDVSREEFDLASNWTVDGLKAAVTLVIAIMSAELFNQGTWQRVWAAESVPALRKGFFLGSFMVFCLMMFFGIMGMLAYANDPAAYDNYEKWAFLSFFDLLAPLPAGWHIVVLILVTALAASSIDSLQNGMASIFAHDLVYRLGWNPTWVARVLIIAVNIPAIRLASREYDVLSLFLVADLVCATSVFPVFLGLQRQDYGILKAPTEFGAFMGCISGIVTVLINGVVNDAEGGIFEYFWLPNKSICSLCGSKTMISFIITPIASAIMTYVFSFLDIALRGDCARKPLITFPFDKEDKHYGDNIDEEAVAAEVIHVENMDKMGDVHVENTDKMRDDDDDDDDDKDKLGENPVDQPGTIGT